MNRLLIIGNGFDRAHGMPTKYTDFMKYLLSYEQKPPLMKGNFAYLNSISPSDEAKRRFYDAISKYIPEQDLWCSFEEALGYLDYEQIQTANSCYFLDYGDDNWHDSANHDFQYMIGEDLSFASEIPHLFFEWIKSIDTDVPPIVSQNVINKHCLFMNFNYTDTLEKAYAIPTTNILYIHGNALHGDNLILGHHDDALFLERAIPAFTSAEEQGMYIESIDEDFRLQEAREIIKGYFRKTYKDTVSIIKHNQLFFNSLSMINEVFVLGHSLSAIDIDYFIEITKYVSPICRWYISYFTQDDLCKVNYFVKTLGLQNYQLITFADIE